MLGKLDEIEVRFSKVDTSMKINTHDALCDFKT